MNNHPHRMQITETGGFKIGVEAKGHERRDYRRHDLDGRSIRVERWEGNGRTAAAFGEVVDLSASGVRIRANLGTVRADQQIRVRMTLPRYAGICPFIDSTGENPKPKQEWIGWMTVTRVQQLDASHMEIAGKLVDMDEIDRGMLGLYLSTQPLAA